MDRDDLSEISADHRNPSAVPANPVADFDAESKDTLNTKKGAKSVKSGMSGSQRGSSAQSNVSPVPDDAFEGSGSVFGGPTPPPEVNMKIPPNHLDLGQILPSLGELRGWSRCH